MKQVESLMTRDPQVCGAHDSLRSAAQKFAQHDCGCLPVVDSDGKPIGTVTDRDVCLAACDTDRPLSELRVEDAMARGVYTCRPDQDVRDAERVMQEHQIRRIVVVDSDGHVCGMLSQNDIIQDARRRGDVSGEEVVETLSAIGRPTASSRS